MAPVKVGVNGIGRIGHLAVRLAFERPDKFEIVHLNDIGSCESIAYLIKRDSVHGTWNHGAKADGNTIILSDADTGRTVRVPFSSSKTPSGLADAYKAAGVQMVLECTGEFLKRANLDPYFKECGAKKIVVSAPVKDTPEVLNVVVGCNHHLYNPAADHIVTAASCTTNCLAPVVKVIHEKIGIVHGCITTAHNLTNTQTLLDAPINKKNDLRRGRSGFTNMAPTSTGSATAIALIFPELKGKLNGLAIRVPLTNSSITDCVFEVKRQTTVEEVNALLKAAAEEGPLKGILGFETEQLVSTDYVNDPRSGIVDAECTQVIDGTMVKLYAWYDNEFGYSMRMIELAEMVAASM